MSHEFDRSGDYQTIQGTKPLLLIQVVTTTNVDEDGSVLSKDQKQQQSSKEENEGAIILLFFLWLRTLAAVILYNGRNGVSSGLFPRHNIHGTA